MLDRAIANLVSNAIYYTEREEGQVAVRTTKDRVRVEVRDTGIGIPEKELAQVQNRFYRVNKDRSKTSGGSGLGLAIAKEIIFAHNSELQITSKLNEGTLVGFELAVAG